MKTYALLLISAIVTYNSATVSAQQQYQIKLVEIHGETLGNLPQFAVGGSINIGKEFIGSVIEYNFRKVNLDKLSATGTVQIHEFFFGLRIYPMRPTFMFGNLAIRPTAGAMYGLDLEPNWRGIIFAGLALSPITSTSGITINYVYRPGTLPATGFLLEPSHTVRLGILLGPSFN